MCSSRALTVTLCACLCGAVAPPVAVAGRQPSAPTLSRAQRAALAAAVKAVDRVAAAPSPAPSADITPAVWQSHVLRASDGSHYVALRALAGGLTPPGQPVVLYVRLSTRRSESATTLAERSAVREWLEGERSDPLPMRVGGSMSVPRGEMPVGSISLSGRDPGAESIAALRLLTLERERAARQREDREAERRAELENAARGRASPMLPFEDFDLAADLRAGPRGGVDVQRSVAAGPGDYDLHVAWAAVATRGSEPGEVRVLSHRLRLPAVSPDFGVSDVIIADSATPLAVAYPAARQNAHPYATGAIEVTPAAGNRLRADGALNLVAQIVNPSAGPTGKPDVTVGFRLTRLDGTRETFVATLPPQHYDASKLPADFDAARGHPLFAAVRASLATLTRGAYRVTVSAEDHLAGRTASAEATFDVIGTPASLLREAPRPGQAFRREILLTPTALAAFARAVAPPQPSPPLARALEAAAAGRFASLIAAEAPDAAERPALQALRALALYALGDAPRNVNVQVQAARALGAPAPPVGLLQGAVLALNSDDAGAIAVWQQSREAGIEDAVVAPLLIDAYLRQGDALRAMAMARAALDTERDNRAAARTLVAIHLAGNRAADALQLLDGPPLAGDTSMETRFLRVHALFAGVVSARAAGTAAGTRERFETAAGAYVDDGGPHAILVTAWRQALADTP